MGSASARDDGSRAAAPRGGAGAPSDEAIRDALARARRHLELRAGLDARPRHYRRPPERPFTADERSRVTILIGGLTRTHEALIKAVLEHSGYRCDILPTPDALAFQIGKDYGNNAQCNPSYFCVGSLIQYLRGLEATGLARDEIIDRHVFFTAGTCGPCRFGMYESEYRLALRNAGFDGFRVLTFSQSDGVRADTGAPGLRFTIDLGMGAVAAFNAGDVLNDLSRRLRPYEVHAGETDRALARVVGAVSGALRNRPPFELAGALPRRIARRVDVDGRQYRLFNSLGKVASHLYGRYTRDAYRSCLEALASIQLDYTRVRPVVKVVGEFWAQTTEGDGNFRMFEFLEGEGAHVLVDPLGVWVTYLLHQRRASLRARRAADARYYRPAPWALHRHLANAVAFSRRWALFWLGERWWMHEYGRVARALGGTNGTLVPQAVLARLADPFYHHLARGGEGHLEVGKSVYYTVTRGCHMVVSLKPFGCLPSTQSDGVHAAVVSRYPDMIFVPVETSGDGQMSAYNRVQMALGEARAIARDEFDRALAGTGSSLDDIRGFVAEHAELRSPFYPIPKQPRVAGVAANFVAHVGKVMTGRARLARPTVEVPR